MSYAFYNYLYLHVFLQGEQLHEIHLITTAYREKYVGHRRGGAASQMAVGADGLP